MSFEAFAALPAPLFPNAVSALVFALSVLRAVKPFALVLPAVGPADPTEPMLLVIKIIPLVDSAIRPLEIPLPMHFVILPMSFVLFPISPRYLTEAFHHVVFEITLVDRAVGPGKLSFALFYSLIVHAA